MNFELDRAVSSFIHHSVDKSGVSDDQALPLALAIAGFAAIVIGIYQGLVHVAPGYGELTIVTGWGGDLNHEERLLAALGAVGLGGTVGLRKWARLAVVPVAMGAIVLFYALRAMLEYVQRLPLYTEVQTYGGDPAMFIFGAEPFLLIGGGLLLIGAGIGGRRRQPSRENGDETSAAASSIS